MSVIQKRLEHWKEKLIDLSLRNRLLNFRPTKATTIRIIEEIPSEIYKILKEEDKKMSFLPIKSSEKDEDEEDIKKKEEEIEQKKVESKEFYKDEELEEKHLDLYLQTNLKKERLARNLRRIYSKASSIMEEHGYNVLFLGLGFVEWYESENSQKKLLAPLMLLPVELKRRSVKGSFKLYYDSSEAPILNPALLVKLEKDFGINFDFTEDFLEELSPEQVFVKAQKIIKGQKRWRVTNDIYLSLFSFSKFIMYKDFEKNRKKFLNNKIIKTICGEAEELSNIDLNWEPQEIDSYFRPLHTFQVLDADSSQQKAIMAVKKGCDFVMEGPPGTGKSQTIANIISECLADGKKVLFVSQKMAALEVVKKRLTQVGLNNYCLELHSRKTSKNIVVKELAKTLEELKQVDHQHDKELLKLEKIKEQLNKYVNELHTSYGKLRMTPYQAFGIISLCNVNNDLGVIFDNAKNWGKRQYDNCCNLLDNLENHLVFIGPPKDHNWYGSELTEINYREKLKIQEYMINFVHSLEGLKTVKEHLSNLCYFKNPSTLGEIDMLLDASKLLNTMPRIPFSIFKDQRWDSRRLEIEKLVQNIKFFSNYKNELSDKYNKEIFQLKDLADISNNYKTASRNIIFIFNSIFLRSRNKIKPLLKNRKKYNPSLKEIVNDLEKIKLGQDFLKKIEDKSELARDLFDDFWEGIDTSYEQVYKVFNWVKSFRYYLSNSYFHKEIIQKVEGQQINLEEIERKRDQLTRNLENFNEFINCLFESIKFNINKYFGKNFKEIKLNDINLKIINMKKSIDNVDNWLRYQRLLESSKEQGLGYFIDKLLSTGVSLENLADLFKNEFLKSWLDACFEERKDLKFFSGIKHEKLIRDFRKLDNKQINLAKIRIRHKLSGNIDGEWDASNYSELGVLKREIKKSRKHLSIRKLFQLCPHILLDLKPCLMMSPLTVSQFLDFNLLNFDVVVFDEASQITPEDSLGCIVRGKQAIIAGDSKQLPPTTFFQREVLTPEDSEVDFEDIIQTDLDSILDECVVSQFYRVMLRWHYRSKHEELIAFSNKYFYKNHLNTFPCVEEKSEHLGINFHYLPNCTYDRGGSGKNKDEAMAVARAVLNHFRNYPHLSLGVGTFSTRQKYAIEDAIEILLKKDASLESFFSKDKFEHFFIKNLEIIQGDERDVIFISIGYGKDNQGKLSMNFGPINKSGGERRLNVLVTRSREKLEIFSSIRGDDFDLRKTNSEGVHLLKKYLDYAEKGSVILSQNIKEDNVAISESPFEEAVYNALIRKGMKAKKQIGCSGYRIDLAIVDENNPGKYILGIECDGAQYHSSGTARDRDRLRQDILESLGWNIYRIWSTDWFKSPREEIEKLLEVIERAQEGTFKKKIELDKSSRLQYKYKKKTNVSGICAKPYVKIKTKEKYSSEYFYDQFNLEPIRILKRVVKIEGPIRKDEAWRRVIRFWGMNSLGARIRRYADLFEEECLQDGSIKKKNNFYWPSKLKKAPVRKRDTNKINTSIDFVAPEEIGEAALIVLKREYSLPEDNLIKQTSKLLGFSRKLGKNFKYLKKSIRSYIRKGKIIKNGNRLTCSD